MRQAVDQGEGRDAQHHQPGISARPPLAGAVALPINRLGIAVRIGRRCDAAVGRALPANGNREHYIRASLGVNEDGHRIVEPWELQDSSLLGVFDRADALIRLKPNAPATESGAIVDVLTHMRDPEVEAKTRRTMMELASAFPVPGITSDAGWPGR